MDHRSQRRRGTVSSECLEHSDFSQGTKVRKLLSKPHSRQSSVLVNDIIIYRPTLCILPVERRFQACVDRVAARGARRDSSQKTPQLMAEGPNRLAPSYGITMRIRLSSRNNGRVRWERLSRRYGMAQGEQSRSNTPRRPEYRNDFGNSTVDSSDLPLVPSISVLTGAGEHVLGSDAAEMEYPFQ